MIAFAAFLRGAARLFPAWVWAGLAGLVACILVGFFSYRNGAADERVAEALRTAKANAAAQQLDAAAKEATSAERLSDALENDANQKELLDAVKNLDGATSDPRRALACARLRQQGTDTASLPACRGFEG